jgi:ubiquinone/menaquinone biosynthesis C-methylase UbiE
MSDWFRTAFTNEYLALYAHRDEVEAKATVDLLIRELQLAPGSHVLDAPCGAGRHARHFALQSMRVVALDLSRDMIETARSNTPRTCAISFLRADLRHLPLADNRFDAVTNLFSSFGYFATDEENASVVAQLARVCRSSGHVVIDFMNAPRVRSHLRPYTERRTVDGRLVREERSITESSPRIEKKTILHEHDGTVREAFESVRLFARHELEQMMQECGLRVTRVLGNYHGGEHTAESPRVILFGQKA